MRSPRLPLILKDISGREVDLMRFRERDFHCRSALRPIDLYSFGNPKSEMLWNMRIRRKCLSKSDIGLFVSVLPVYKRCHPVELLETFDEVARSVEPASVGYVGDVL